jgi:hypothetical protein
MLHAGRDPSHFTIGTDLHPCRQGPVTRRDHQNYVRMVKKLALRSFDAATMLLSCRFKTEAIPS